MRVQLMGAAFSRRGCGEGRQDVPKVGLEGLAERPRNGQRQCVCVSHGEGGVKSDKRRPFS